MIEWFNVSCYSELFDSYAKSFRDWAIPAPCHVFKMFRSMDHGCLD